MKHKFLTITVAFLFGFSLYGCGGGSSGSSDAPGPEDKDPASLLSVTLSPASVEIKPGSTQQFTATGRYDDNTTQDLTPFADWACVNDTVTVASIDESGLATGVCEGTATISAAYNGKSGSATLTVKNEVTPPTLESITLEPADATITEGSTRQFTATERYSDGSTQDVTLEAEWASSNMGAATVGAGGLVTGVAAGTTTISASIHGASGTTNLTVEEDAPPPPTLVSISISPSDPVITLGNPQQFKATALYSDDSTQDVTLETDWDSTDEAVATISAGGLATGITVGTTTIGAYFDGEYASTSLEITEPKVYEEIFICDGYVAAGHLMPQCEPVLTGLGAVEVQDGVWEYENPVSGKAYRIYEVTTPEGMEQALKTENAHVIYSGHSNYGLGATFTWTDAAQERIRYVDDDLIVNFSTDMVSVSLEGLIFSQAYPNLRPIYKDGESAIMPYNFGDPRGDPPFNYLLTYKVPGDDRMYFIERPDGSKIDRFENSGKIAWKWPHGEGIPPNQNNPDERKYFIVNPATEWDHFEAVGTWTYATAVSGYRSYNYQYLSAGNTAADTATWTVVVSMPGYYDVQASLFYDTPNATNVVYVIEHADGVDEIAVDQRNAPGGIAPRTFTMKNLGEYYFEAGGYEITVYGGANGRIIADYIYLNGERRIRVDNTDLYKSHFTGGRYASNTILNMEGKTIPEEELRYKRMFYSACYSGRYFLGKFHRGQMFFTLAHTDGHGNPIPEYLERYLLGQTDQQIQDWLNESPDNIYDYYDFDQIPPSMR